jgi:hypothetical protein
MHILDLWDNYVTLSRARNVCIIAHGYGGELVKELMEKRPESAIPRLRAINFVDSSHRIKGTESAAVLNCLSRRVINWQMSDLNKGMPLLALREVKQCVCLSAGNTGGVKMEELNKPLALSLIIDETFEYMEASISDNVDSQGFVAYKVGISSDLYIANEERYEESLTTPNPDTDHLGYRRDVDSRRVPWVASHTVSQCQRCEAKFGFFKRKHHCRACGYVVCLKCSEHKLYLPGYVKPERVCIVCCSKAVSESESVVAVKKDDFKMLKIIGKGQFGKVVMVRKISNGRVYAMKIIGKEYFSEVERRILEGVRHPFISQLKYAFQTSKKLYYVMDYLRGGELFQLLRKFGNFHEAHVRFYAAEIISALKHLHRLDVAYRDLKPENILLCDEGHLCIVDFGLSKVGVGENTGASSFVGSPEYTAPELLLRKEYGKAVDLWSLGMLIYEMLTGVLPFYSENKHEVYWNILNEPIAFPEMLSPAACNLLEGLLKKDPTERLGMSDVMTHAFFDGTDWEAVERKEIAPPYKPQVKSASDTRNFDSEFTNMPLQESVADSASLLVSGEDRFDGFTYVESGELGLSVK